MSAAAPDNTLELELLARGATLVAGCDEVGRGAACGPVTVGAVIAGSGAAPQGVRDSKLLRPAVRAELEPAIHAWAAAWSVGEASAAEIDQVGMAAALKLAARRALDALTPAPDAVILDGPHDYIGAPWDVTARAKADMTSLVVAAASIVAKEHRDRVLRQLAEQHPVYGLDRNAGYLSAAHQAALREHGPVEGLHRLSWKFVDDLPGFTHMRKPVPGPAGDVQLRLL